MSDQAKPCCCGNKKICGPLAVNDYVHELPGPDQFCGPMDRHTIRNQQYEIVRLTEELRRARPSPSEEALRKAAVLLVDESERILFAKQENGGDHPGLALALTRMNAALSSSAPVSEAKECRDCVDPAQGVCHEHATPEPAKPCRRSETGWCWTHDKICEPTPSLPKEHT